MDCCAAGGDVAGETVTADTCGHLSGRWAGRTPAWPGLRTQVRWAVGAPQMLSRRLAG